MSSISLYRLFAKKIELLSPAEKQVFFYIDNHISDVEKMTLVSLAETTNVSTTTVIRMCHKLKLSGFSELKFLLQPSKAEPENHSEDYALTFLETIRSGVGQLPRREIEQLATRIVYASKIYIACLGMTKTLGEYFSKSLVTSKKNVVFTYDSFIIDILPQIVERDDLIIIISESGNTANTLSLAEHLKYNLSNVVSIVNNPNALISQYVETVIYASSEEFDEDVFKHHHAPLLIVIDLILNIFEKKK
ncbi:MurR/RpiR family transcriptional regulator [Listeria booriae]|uniref:MurR/RpiR family transcriptional regulator n=1 Tax=Listeria booriae TaxID=1552123 RepID=UPI001625D965|nr:MurR/RpiR family transcriptional regulator [Listeria booriae]MBC1210879.1 MurR/RpiR family transcriptional regulator [Listeria booriae]